MPPTHRTPFAGELSAALKALAPAGQQRDFRANEVIFSAGDPGDGFYVVEFGRVRISAAVVGDVDRELAAIGPGDFFGEMAVLDEAPRSATARAESDTRTLFLRRQELLNLIERRPPLALTLIREFCNRMRTLNRKYVDEIVQAERLAVVGRFAGTIVHDFMNPLTIIGLAAELACGDATTPPMRQRAQNRIAHQVDRMTNMLQELIEFTKPSGRRPALQEVVFARYMNPLAEEIRPEIAERGVELVLETPPPETTVSVDPRLLSRLFYNLLNNAVDEMSDGGRILLRFVVGQGELQVEIEDTGRGIAPEIANLALPAVCQPRQGPRNRTRPDHLQEDHRRSWGPHLGQKRTRQGSHLLLHPAAQPGRCGRLTRHRRRSVFRPANPR